MKTQETSPQTLVAILIAAHRHGNRELERDMRSRLKREHGVTLRFARESARREVAHAH